jgi:putative nucleotidyltransferase with HDIG domain
MLTPNVRRILERNSNNIGTLPTIIVNLLKILNDPRSSAQDLADVISVDQVLSAKLLQLVNSAYFGLRKEVIDVRQAISMIGYNTVRSFTLCISLFDSVFPKGTGAVFSKEQFWLHSIAVGVFARRIATRLNLENVEDYFVAGLVHDMGKVFMFQYMSQSFYMAISNARKNKISFYQAEKRSIESDHTEIGAWVMEKWKLPELLIRCVNYHHQDVANNKTIMPHEIISLADNMAKESKVGDSGDEHILVKYQELKDKYSINQGWIDETAEQVRKEVAAFAEVIIKKTSESPI